MRRALPALLPLITLTAGCAGDSPPGITESAVGVVAAGCSLVDGTGSGVVIETDDVLVVGTSAHVVAGARALRVIDGEGAEHDGTLIAFDAQNDLALLEVPTLSSPALPLSFDSPTGAGVLLHFDAGAPVASDIDVLRHVPVEIEDIFIDNRVRRDGVEFEGAVEAGDSGGAVVIDGEVVAIVYARSRAGGSGWAVSTRSLDTLIRDGVGTGHDRCVP